mgnify:CR=1 FL=1
MRTMPAALLLGCLGLAACSPPQPPDEERRPQPKAQETRPQSGIVQAADAYKDAARAAATQSENAAAKEKAALDAATR